MSDGHGKSTFVSWWLGVFTLLLLFLLPFREVLFPTWPTVHVYYLIALGIISIVLIWKGELPLPSSPLALCFIGWLTIQLVRAPDWDSALGLVEVWGSSMLLAGCFMAAFRRDDNWAWAFLFGLWGLATFISVLNPAWQVPFEQMEEVLNEETLDPDYRDALLHAAAQQRFHFPFGNPIDLGVFLSLPLLAVPFLGSLIRKQGSSLILWCGLVLSAGLQLFVLWGSRSRTPLLGLLVGILVQVILFRGFSRRILAALIGAAGVFLIVLVASPGGRAMLSRTETVHARLIYWNAALRLAEQNPLMGAGIGGYGAWYPGVRGLTPHQTLYPHNVVLEVMTDTGAIGLVLFLLLIYQLTAHFFHRRIDSPEAIWQLSALSCFMASTLVGFHHNISTLLSLAAIIAVFPSGGRTTSRPKQQNRTGQQILWGIGVVLFIALVSLRAYSHMLYDQASKSFQVDRDVLGCLRNLDRSLLFWPPSTDALSYRAGLMTEMGNLPAAETDLKKALAWSPHAPYLHDQLADVFSAQGKKEQALFEVQRAIALHPVKWNYHDHASRLLFDLGRKEKALDERSQAESLKAYEPRYDEALKASLPSSGSR